MSPRGQLGFRFATWGGRRFGAGRPPKSGRAGVSHLARASLASRFPVLVTWRVAAHVPDLRASRQWKVMVRALAAVRRTRDSNGTVLETAAERARVVHFSVQSNHVHLIVEARDARTLSTFLQGLAIRAARGLNRVRGRSGRVFADRFHSRILRTPLEVHRAVRYVLVNARKHSSQRGRPFPPGWMDPCSSGRWFDGWKVPDAVDRAIGLGGPDRDGTSDPPVSEPRTWLLRVGWRRHGLLDADVGPARGA